MKNIHILPTDKPSRLVRNGENTLKLCIQTLPIDDEIYCYPQNIYITSDEEIKEGDYCIDGDDIYGPFEKGDIATVEFIKIILTTDEQLIRYGVQPIPDEFLEWFVKNPSCEEVEVKHKDIIQYGNMTMYDHNGDGSHYFCKDCEVETSRSKEELLNFGVEYYKIIIPKEEPKQETPEEETLTKIKFVLSCGNDSQAIRLLEQYGQWQQEKSYSDENMRKAFCAGFASNVTSSINDAFEKWFEQFKKK